MNNKIRTEFGFKTVSIGSITIYTGKIRIKEDASRLQFVLQNYVEHVRFSETVKDWNKVYTTISFETTSATLNAQLIRVIMQIMCTIAHERINAKYEMHFGLKQADVESLIEF